MATNVYIKDYDGDAEYKKLHQKITADEMLDDEDLMKLVFLSLMKSREEGKKEREKEIARTALKEGAEVEFVVKITGLDKQIVLKLKEELN
jgi:hypothetical protein